MTQLQEPIVTAQLFVVESIAMKYAAAQQAVITAKKVNLILSPEAFVWAPDSVDITPLITAELDKSIPTVATTVPANWRPSRQGAQVFQQIQQLFENAARQQAAQAQAQAQPGQPAPVATPAPQPDSR